MSAVHPCVSTLVFFFTADEAAVPPKRVCACLLTAALSLVGI